MLKIKDEFAKILKLFSSVEKVETPPICMTVYYRIKSTVIFPFKIAIHFVVLNFNSLTSFLSRFRVTFEVSALSLTIPDKIFQETKFEGKNKFLL